MTLMSNQSYLSVWCEDFSEERMIERYGEFLTTVPFSAGKPGFSYLTIRAVDPSESPIFEQDLRSVPLDPGGIIELVKDHLHSDCAYEAQAHWDLWSFEPAASAGWRNEPQPVELICYGEDYDGGAHSESGHLQAVLGFEHFFTGHAGLLGMRRDPAAAAQSPEEARFLEAMAWPENLEKYQERTRENIRRLMDWVRNIERAIPDGRVRLWSEGEDNFEARLEEILAAR
ncbi:MAG TPA: hypothetical protein VMB47_02665 [Candidatus Aquilonibacter sp.]|nr:hypothetical protein [Candidatus Aquilonibacter sp.]